ncbi:MAG: J domain-containing protein [Deltaproteobacteria bacterium]|nr:J domain-containing protein [Deltaproteobacteria bacterium]
MENDYYRILGVTRNATADEIRRAYRSRAFELHPDRNGGTREAEEAFKRLTEAYAVLADPARRASYDRAESWEQGSRGGEFRPEDVFEDLFRNPAFRSLFSQLTAEFARQGLRFDEEYFRRFSTPQGGVFAFRGFVFFGPLGGLFSSLGRRGDKPVSESTRPRMGRRTKQPLLRRLVQALPGLLRMQTGPDLQFKLPVGADILRSGGTVRATLPLPSGTKTYQVRIPPGSTPGTRLRLAGQGMDARSGRGDVYLELRSAD